MRTKILTFIVLSLLVAIGTTGCSDDKNPDDYLESRAKRDYSSKDDNAKLTVFVNGEESPVNGTVKFFSKDMIVADFTFINVIPGIKEKIFKDVPITYPDDDIDISFKIKSSTEDGDIIITGVFWPEKMTVNIEM